MPAPAPEKEFRRAVFLDRDGTLIEEKEYLHQPEDVAYFPQAIHALARLDQAGFLLFLVTNQSGVGRGYFTLNDVDRVHHRIAADLAAQGVQFQKIYVAPEHPDQPSVGRKPSPHFLFAARDEFGLDLSASYMIGDKWIDLQCGWNAGVARSILVRTGYGRSVEKENPPGLDRAIVKDGLIDAAEWILDHSPQTESRPGPA